MEENTKVEKELDSDKYESIVNVRETTKSPSQGDDDEVFYDFQLFVSQMKDQRSDPIVRYTRSFLHNFVTKKEIWSVEEQIKLINDFKLFIYDKFLEYEPFKSLDRPRLHNAKEGMEKLIMGKLYGKCFSPCLSEHPESLTGQHKLDLCQDIQLRDKIMEYRFVEPSNLEIPATISSRIKTFVRLSGRELNRINNYRAPRDKMVCILNSCKVIFGFLKHSKLENGGADIFIPLLIYTILKADVTSLVSNVTYTDRFRFPEFLRGESAYYLSSLQGAINFILAMDSDSLYVPDKQAFQREYAANSSKVMEEKAQLDLQKKTIPAKPNQNAKSPSPSQYILKPLDGATNTVISRFTELFSSGSPDQNNHDDHQPHSKLIDDKEAAIIAQQMEEDDHARILKDLQAMFPEMGCDLIQDVCAAKKYRIGVCVDVLLTLSS